jgi:hypothetical protein
MFALLMKIKASADSFYLCQIFPCSVGCVSVLEIWPLINITKHQCRRFESIIQYPYILRAFYGLMSCLKLYLSFSKFSPEVSHPIFLKTVCSNLTVNQGFTDFKKCRRHLEIPCASSILRTNKAPPYKI